MLQSCLSSLQIASRQQDNSFEQMEVFIKLLSYVLVHSPRNNEIFPANVFVTFKGDKTHVNNLHTLCWIIGFWKRLWEHSWRGFSRMCSFSACAPCLRLLVLKLMLVCLITRLMNQASTQRMMSSLPEKMKLCAVLWKRSLSHDSPHTVTMTCNYVWKCRVCSKKPFRFFHDLNKCTSFIKQKYLCCFIRKSVPTQKSTASLL